MSHATRAHQIYVPHGILRGAVCAMTVALFAAPAAFADARRDAKRHFRDGMALIASGQVERGIAELKQAYAVKPHADLLYNIARAYVDLGRIPEALDYFQRYVATDPDDRAQVEAVIARLSGAIGARPPVAQTPAPSVDTSQLLAALQELIERNKAPATLAASKGAAARAAPANGKEKDEEGMFEATSVAARTRATAQEIASALYGANAYAGVVNIITKTGDEVNGGRAFLQTGNYGTLQGALSAGGRNGKLTYRTSLAYDHADKWSNEAPAGFSPQFSQPGRSREIQRAELAAEYQSSGLQVRAGAGFDNMNAMEVFPLGSLRTFGNEGQGGFLRAEASYGETDVKVYWNALRMRSGPEYWPSVLPSILASVRSDVIDASARTGLQYQLLGRHRFNFGAGFRYSTVDWGFLTQRADGGTRYTQEHFSGFLQDEWEPSRRVTVTLSYRVDRHPLLADQHITAGGLVHSPRGTVLLEAARDHFLRFTAGTAFRAPTFLESYANLFAPVAPGAGIRFQGDLNLKPEEMLQAELGYKGRIGDQLTPEAVVYVERVRNLITDGALQPAPPGTSAGGQTVLGFTGFQNEPNLFVGVGAELGLRYQPADGIDVSVNYSFEKLSDCTSTCTTDHALANQSSATVANTAQHKLNVVATWRTRASFDLGVDAHYVSSVTWFE